MDEREDWCGFGRVQRLLKGLNNKEGLFLGFSPFLFLSLLSFIIIVIYEGHAGALGELSTKKTCCFQPETFHLSICSHARHVVERAVDLTNLGGYGELITELEQMFEIEGELRQRNKWEVVFTDDEADTMLVGDDAWPLFCKMVRKILVYTSEEVKKMKPKSKLSAPPSAEAEGAGSRVDAVFIQKEPKAE